MSLERAVTSEAGIEKFRSILKEFIQVMIFLTILGVTAFWYISQFQKSRQIIFCDAEKVGKRLGDDHFIVDNAIFSGGAFQTQVQALSGQYSMLLNEEHPFGFEISFESLTGTEIVHASVWRFLDGSVLQEGQLVVTVPGILYESAHESVESNPKGWQKLNLSFTIGCEAENKTLKIFCWNPSGVAVYFDDIRIEITRNPN